MSLLLLENLTVEVVVVVRSSLMANCLLMLIAHCHEYSSGVWLGQLKNRPKGANRPLPTVFSMRYAQNALIHLSGRLA